MKADPNQTFTFKVVLIGEDGSVPDDGMITEFELSQAPERNRRLVVETEIHLHLVRITNKNIVGTEGQADYLPAFVDCGQYVLLVEVILQSQRRRPDRILTKHGS